MEVEFVKLSPSQNMTILVTSPVDRWLYHDVAARIMAYDSVYAEQVGFVEEPGGGSEAAGCLRMAGGEFCVNASLAFCAYLVWKGEVSGAGPHRIPIEVSGANEIIYCDITEEEGHYLGKISVPAPVAIETLDAEVMGVRYGFPLVRLPGIAHVIVNAGTAGTVIAGRDAFADALIYAADPFVAEDALGIMFFDAATGVMDPYVRVRTAGTKMWERSCGSGAAAVGAYLADMAGKSLKTDITQPGGLITVEAAVADGRVMGMSIQGRITIAAYGKAIINP